MLLLFMLSPKFAVMEPLKVAPVEPKVFPPVKLLMPDCVAQVGQLTVTAPVEPETAIGEVAASEVTPDPPPPQPEQIPPTVRLLTLALRAPSRMMNPFCTSDPEKLMFNQRAGPVPDPRLYVA